MNIIIKTNHMSLGSDLEAYIREKLAGIEKLVKGDSQNVKIEVKIGRTTTHHRQGEVFEAEINFNHAGEYHHAAATLTDVRAAFDEAKNELVAEITSRKDKEMTLVRRGRKVFKDMVRGILRRK